MAFTFGSDRFKNSGDDEVLELLSKQRVLNNTVATLKTKAAEGDVSREHLLSSIADLEKALSIINTKVLADLRPEHFAAYCPPHATGRAQKVFNVPELLEMILEYLDIDYLLGVQFVNRQFRDAVDSSNRLQRKLSLVPLPNYSVPLTDLDDLPGFYLNTVDYSLGSFEELDCDQVAVQARFGVEPPRIGAKCRRMLVAHPPLKGMRAFIDCCDGRRNARTRGMNMVSDEEGITVGTLLNAAETLKRSHLHCRNAPLKMHNRVHGCVDTTVTFEAVVRLRKDDPWNKEDPVNAARWRENARESKAEWKLMQAFVEEKRQAQANALELPELPKFRETYVAENEAEDEADSGDESEEE